MDETNEEKADAQISNKRKSSSSNKEEKKKKKKKEKKEKRDLSPPAPQRSSRSLRTRVKRGGVIIITPYKGNDNQDMFRLTGDDVDKFDELVGLTDIGAQKEKANIWVLPVLKAESLNDALADHAFGVRGVDLSRHF